MQYAKGHNYNMQTISVLKPTLWYYSENNPAQRHIKMLTRSFNAAAIDTIMHTEHFFYSTTFSNHDNILLSYLPCTLPLKAFEPHT